MMVFNEKTLPTEVLFLQMQIFALSPKTFANLRET